MPVALFTGAWIEMPIPQLTLTNADVALFTGAWIEIEWQKKYSWVLTSHSSRVRGLKSRRLQIAVSAVGRTLHGCVD